MAHLDDEEYLDLPVLNKRQQAFVDWYVTGLNATAAARKAGYGGSRANGTKLLKNPDVVAHIEYHQQAHAREMKMTRERVQAGLLEAIDLAKELSDPGNMIRGWAEVARITGLNQPEKHEVDIRALPAGGQALLKQLEKLSTTQLLEMAGRETDAIDGQFEEIFDSDLN